MIFFIFSLIITALIYGIVGELFIDRDIYRMKRERKKRQEDMRKQFEKDCEDADYLELQDQKREITKKL